MVGSLKKGVISFSTVAMIAFQRRPYQGLFGSGTNKRSADTGAEVLALHEIAIFFYYC